MLNAVTLDTITKDFYEKFDFISDLQISTGEGESEVVEAQFEIQYSNIYISFGLFGIILGTLLLALFLYSILNLKVMRFKCLSKPRRFLENKLFYSVWIRYMIESNF